MTEARTPADAAVSTLVNDGQIFTEAEIDTDPPQYCTMFHHMVKSGGTSIKNQLYRASQEEGRQAPALCILGNNNQKGCVDALHHSSVVVGYVELLRKPMKEIGRNCQYFTMMRHPIDRLVSAFYYCPRINDIQSRPSQWCGMEEDPAPLESRLMDFLQGDWKCKALIQLSFSQSCPRGSFCKSSDRPSWPTRMQSAADWPYLALAERILLSYDAVGIFEEWELSMKLFDAVVESPVRSWDSSVADNSGLQSKQRRELLAWAHRSPELRQVLAADLLIYDLAVSMFNGQINQALHNRPGNGTNAMRRGGSGAS